MDLAKLLKDLEMAIKNVATTKVSLEKAQAALDAAKEQFAAAVDSAQALKGSLDNQISEVIPGFRKS